MATFSLKNLT